MATNLGERTGCAHCGSVLLVCQNPDCRRPFPRRPDEPEQRWRTRQYCSAPCAQKMRQKVRFAGSEPATKVCEQCGGPAVQRKGESPASFEARKYCSVLCSQQARRSAGQERAAQAEQRRAARAHERAARPEPEPERKLVHDIPIVHPQPSPDVWRPAAWRELEKTR